MTQKVDKPQDARAIANYILDKASEYKIGDLSLMKLLKLIYMAHGWSFYFCEKPLVSEQPEAWPYGPVYPKVYWFYSENGGRGALPIESDEKIKNKETLAPYCADLTEKQEGTIAAVLKLYGPMTAFKLSNITHLDGSPWAKTVKRDRGYWGEIPEQAMSDYYIESAKERGMPIKAA